MQSKFTKWLGLVLVITFVAGWAFSKYRFVKNQIAEEVTEKAQGPRTLHLFAMSDYLPTQVIEGFEKKFNAKVQYDVFANNEELLAKFQSGAKGYDVIVPSDYMVAALIQGGYLSTLDHTKLPNLKNLHPEFTKVPYDQGNAHTVPYTWGTTGIIYNSKLVKEKLTSWKQLFDNKYKGKIALLDDLREVFGGMLHTLGYSSNTTKPEELKAAQQELIKLKPSVRLFSSDPKQHILNGDIWIAQIYSGDAKLVQRENPDLQYVVPKEGATIWIDNLAVPTSARDADLAHAFINYVLEAEVDALLTNELGYASPNQGAAPKIQDPTLRADHIRKIGLSSLEFLKDLGSATDALDQLWTEAKTK